MPHRLRLVLLSSASSILVKSQFHTDDVGIVRECFGLQEEAACTSGANGTATGGYFNEDVTAAECFEGCYAQDDCLYMAYFITGGLCYTLAECDTISRSAAYSDWRWFERIEFGGTCATTEAPASANRAFVGGGESNYARADDSTIGGGADNIVDTSATGGTVGGGKYNTITSNGLESTIIGGASSSIDASYSTIIGGENHTILENAESATILSGHSHRISGQFATILGGASNTATGSASTIGGGLENTVLGNYAVVVGGSNNAGRGDYSVTGGGIGGLLTSNYAVNMGGFQSYAQSRFAQVLGGSHNMVRGRFSTSLGFQAQATGKYSCSMGFQNGEVCLVSDRKSIGFCGDEVLLGDDGLDLVALAEAKAAIGRRLEDQEERATALQKVADFANAIAEEATELDALLNDLQRLSSL